MVLLDFGLVADLESKVAEATWSGLCSLHGARRAGLRAVGPAADWYSVGVLLSRARAAAGSPAPRATCWC